MFPNVWFTKDYQAVIINMFKKVKEIMFEDLKKSIATMT